MDQALPGHTPTSLARQSANEASDGVTEAPKLPPSILEENALQPSRIEIHKIAQSNNPSPQNDQPNRVGIKESDPLPKISGSTPELHPVSQRIFNSLGSRSYLPLTRKDKVSSHEMESRQADEDPRSNEHDEKAETSGPDTASQPLARENEIRGHSMGIRKDTARARKFYAPVDFQDTVVGDPFTSPYEPRYLRDYQNPFKPIERRSQSPHFPSSHARSTQRPRPPSTHDWADFVPFAAATDAFYESPYGNFQSLQPVYPVRNPLPGNDRAPFTSTTMPQHPRRYQRYSKLARPPQDARFQPQMNPQRYFTDTEWEENDSAGEGTDDVRPEKIPYTLTAELNYVGWQQFKQIRENPRGDSYVIDVLNEEPDVVYTDHNADNPLFHRVMGRYSAQAPKVDGAARGENKPSVPKQFLAGQGPLPERIRINSQRIVHILSRIIGGLEINHHRPLVIVRPYKALVQYEPELRTEAQKLAKKYPCESDKKGSDQPENEEKSLPGNGAMASGDGHANDRPITDIPISECAVGENPSKTQSPEENSRPKSQGELPQGDIAQGILETDPTDSRIALEHLQCLLEFVDREIHAKIQHIENERSQKIYFSDIWFLFKPGDEVIEQTGRQAYRVINVQSMGHRVLPPWASWAERGGIRSREKMTITLTCVYIDFDGFALGPVQEVFKIARFDGQRSITSLPIYPFRFYGKADVRDTFIVRGKMFPDLVDIKHASYSGLTLDTRDDIDGQVVIDFEEAVSVNRDWKPSIENLLGLTAGSLDAKESCTADCCSTEVVLDDFHVERNRYEDLMADLIPQRRDHLPSLVIYPRSISEISSGENRITDSEFLIMSHRVFGFVLHSRKWAKLDLTHLTYPGAPESEQSTSEQKKTPSNQESSFDQLVLPPGHKELVKSLISQHFQYKKSADTDKDQNDIVRGKGKGLILLLHGAPGVGKTTTAECVASYFGKPLFHITCGDLGFWAKDVENTLETNFALANRWGCILLLDEADVFLASRTPTDHMRNSLVSVFLRVLEYYAGILFLTTNRVGDFDEAFASRVHMSLYYPPLNLDSTQQVFGLNLDRIRRRFSRKGRNVDIKNFEIGGFVTNYWQTNPKARWNGRQIRNACQTALALAEFEAQKGNDDIIDVQSAMVYLQVKHFQTVADAYLGFMVYMKNIYGVDADERAKEKFLRAGISGEEQANPLTARRYPNTSAGPFPRANPGGPSAVQTQQQYGYAQPAAGPSPGFHPSIFPQSQGPEYLNTARESIHHVPAVPSPRQVSQSPSEVWKSAERAAAPHGIALQMPLADANAAQYSAQLTPHPSSIHPYGAYQAQNEAGMSSSAHIVAPEPGQPAQSWTRNDQTRPY